MELHFDQELAKLKDTLLRMASVATQSVAEALKALVERDDDMANRVIGNDAVLDQMEIDVDEICLELIALRQPKARDLRLVIMAMKISSDLERIGDQAVSIATRAKSLNKEPLLKPLVNIPQMADLAQGMVRDTLDAFVYGDVAKARDVIQRDQNVDELNDQLHRELTSYMVENPQTITRALNLMTVARKLERVADHAVNICEDVVFLYEGRDIRHQQQKA